MTNEKRKGQDPIPDHLDSYLNEAQMDQLHTIERFGWKLKFVRRPPFQQVVVVVANQDGSSIGILEEDGRVNLEPDIIIRD